MKAISQDHRIIQVKDFGAGSRVFKSNARKVSDIAKNAGISRKRAILLNKLTSYLKINSALELGTSVGISSVAIAAGNNVKLITLEGCPETAGIASEYFERFEVKNIEVRIGEFELLLRDWRGESPLPIAIGTEGELIYQAPNSKFQTPREKEPPAHKTEPQTINHEQHTTYNSPSPLPIAIGTEEELKNQSQESSNSSKPEPQTTNHKQHTTFNPQLTTVNPKLSTDLIYFDGNHQKEATLKYFKVLLSMGHNESVFIFDDIHWSRGMEEAWEEIKQYPEVSVSIDTFFWGIVFFRKEQEKQHFTIRL